MRYNKPYTFELKHIDDVTVTLYRKLGASRWNLVTPQGRIVGWVTRNEDGKTWDVRCASAAFRGSGPDDEGHVLDKVPARLTYETEPFRHDAIAVKNSTLEDAAFELAMHLAQHKAPAIGYGPHYEVKKWSDR